jgi:thymidylate synthase
MGFMNKLDKDYTDLLQDILNNGTTKSDRTGTGTISVFGRQIKHKMSEGFPLLTTKKMPFKTIVTELLWFLRGDTNIKYLVDNGCNIWNGDAYKNFEQKVISEGYQNLVAYYWPSTQEEFINKIKTDDEFAKKWGELGKIYGFQWRNWVNYQPQDYTMKSGLNAVRTVKGETDQIQNLINDLKTNPDSRRLMVNAWAVHDLPNMVLPPCHYGFQVYTRELSLQERYDLIDIELFIQNYKIQSMSFEERKKELDEQNVPTRAISLMWNQRSVDTFLGLPFNIASYGLLLEIIAKEVNMVPDQLIGNLGDVHLYSNHIEQAKEQIGLDLTDEERYNIWFNNNYETGMERYFDPNNLPDFDNEYYEPTPKRTREPFPLPKLAFNPIFLANLEHKGFDEAINGQVNFELENYQSHPTIKAALSN